MMKYDYNKEAKTFSINKKSFIDNYCEVVDDVNEFMPDKPWITVIMNGCYLTASTSLDKILKEPSDIDILIKYNITEVGSTSKKDEYREYPVANIGFSPKENKWYGWSHRAIQGFGIGDTPKEFYPDKTVEGKPIETIEEAKEAAIKFAKSVA